MKTTIITFLIVLCASPTWAQNPTFGFFGVLTYAGTQNCKIEDLDIDIDMPYQIRWGIEGHYMTDDIYYIGKALTAATGEVSVVENGETYINRNGAWVDVSIGGFNTVTDHFGYGVGMRGNFGYTGLVNYNGKIESFHFNLGVEAPVVYSFNKYLRLYAKTSISNVWTNQKVFGGWAWDANADVLFSPFSFLLIGAGVGTDYSSRSVQYNNGDLMNMKTSSLYYRLTIGISLGVCQGY